MTGTNSFAGILIAPQILKIAARSDARGSLGILEWSDVPFTPRRLYFLHEIPAGAVRGGHSHRKSEELLIALSGAVTVTTIQDSSKKRFRLDNASDGLYIPVGVWHQLEDFSGNAVVLAVASEPYDPDDYFS